MHKYCGSEKIVLNEDSSKVTDCFCTSSKSIESSFISSVRYPFFVMTTVFPIMEYLLNISTLLIFDAVPPNILTTTRSASSFDGAFPVLILKIQKVPISFFHYTFGLIHGILHQSLQNLYRCREACRTFSRNTLGQEWIQNDV